MKDLLIEQTTQSPKIDFKTTSALTKIYEDQAKAMKVEDEVAKVFLSREAGKVENAHATLILIKNNYKSLLNIILFK